MSQTDLDVPGANGQTSTQELPEATILFAGDSGDGMQLTGSQFTLATAHAQSDLATLPDYPAEIRAPAGTTYGISGFQVHFGSGQVRTPGDAVDLLVAMNPAAVKVHLGRVERGGAVLINTDAFNDRGLKLADLDADPREDGTLDGYRVIEVELARLTREALADTELSTKEVDRSKNMFALGLSLWLYSRPTQPALDWIGEKFADQRDVRDANRHVLKKGYHYGETTEQFVTRYDVAPAKLEKGTYRTIRGAEALALGLVAAGQESGLGVFYGSYPITPASDILHEMSRHKNFGVMTFQAEDEIAAAGSALGAAFGGQLGVCATSGPGLALKTETIGLAVMTELPMVILNVQRGGPSTGLPTKTEQADLFQALYGRNGDAPLPVIAPDGPADCFRAAYEACRIATKYMTPVILLADVYLANGSEPWKLPAAADLPPFEVNFATAPDANPDANDDSGRDPNDAHVNGKKNGEAPFLPYRRDEDTLVRPWARPGTPGLEHRIGGLEKEAETGDVSYDPKNHQRMTEVRAAKIQRVARDLDPPAVYSAGEDAQQGDLLITGWGSTRGAIETAVDRLRAESRAVSSLHLRTLWPLPPGLREIFKGFDRHLVPEQNNGQLVRLLRDEFLLDFQRFGKVEGQPFTPAEIEARAAAVLGGDAPDHGNASSNGAASSDT
jgi:2-oxoglutarate ferredoxin oxidoreductase subunit alpha